MSLATRLPNLYLDEMAYVPALPEDAGMVGSGRYYRAISPTPGTGIAQSITTGFSATGGVLSMYNNGGTDTMVIPDYIRLIPTVVGASTTRSEGLIAVDTGNRYSSGGSALTVKNANYGSSATSGTTLNFGAVTFSAESGTVRRLSRFQLRSVIMVQFEEWIVKFGGNNYSETMGGAAAIRSMIPVGRVVIPAGSSMTFHLWNPGNAATPPSWEVEVAFWEL